MKKRRKMYKKEPLCIWRPALHLSASTQTNIPIAIIAEVFHLLAGSYLILLSVRSRIPAIALRFPIRNQNLYFTNILPLVQKECLLVFVSVKISPHFSLSAVVSQCQLQGRMSNRLKATRLDCPFQGLFHSLTSPAYWRSLLWGSFTYTIKEG